MSRLFDAKSEALKAYPNDRDAGVQLFLEYLDVNEKDFIYEESQTPEEYIYGAKSRPPRLLNGAMKGERKCPMF